MSAPVTFKGTGLLSKIEINHNRGSIVNFGEKCEKHEKRENRETAKLQKTK